MSTIYLRRTDPTVDAIIRKAFPGFAGKRIEAEITDSITFYGTMWDNGCKRDYVMMRLADMARVSVEQERFMERSEFHDARHAIPAGHVVVVFDRSRAGEAIEIHGPASNITPMLSPPMELSRDERIVLIATKGLKSSYGGDSNFRYKEAKRETGITLVRYNEAKNALIDRKLLNKAGAITVEGQNAIGQVFGFGSVREQVSINGE
jgi:hypothetical protein